MLVSAPHLSNPLPTLTPCYAWWEVPYYWLGLKAYDLVAGAAGLTWSSFVTSHSARSLFPPLATVRSGDPESASLKGGIVYYDGQMDDARINVALATTSALAGAVVVNHVRVARLMKVRLNGTAVPHFCSSICAPDDDVTHNRRMSWVSCAAWHAQTH